jgi:hypothetical protein
MTNHIVDTDLFQAVFRMIELENESNYLVNRLLKKAKLTELSPNSFSLTFEGMKVVLVSDLEIYHLIGPKIIYCNREDETTKLSEDRVYFYLNRILDLVMYGR